MKKEKGITESVEEKQKKNDLKKQLVGAGVYMALAVTVVAVTVSTLATTFSEKDAKNGQKTTINRENGSDIVSKAPKNETKRPLSNESASSEPSLSSKDITLDTPVSDAPQGIDAALTKQKAEEEPESPLQESPKLTTGAPDVSAAEEQALAPDRSVPASEEPAEVVSPIGYDGYVRPCAGYVSKDYSVDVPVYSATMYDYRTHAGVDIACEPGTPIKAVTNGCIKDVFTDALYGVTVVVEHADGMESVYCGLSPELPVETVVGRSVLTGEVLAGAGNSALCESSEVSHVHLELRKDGKSVDPSAYIEF